MLSAILFIYYDKKLIELFVHVNAVSGYMAPEYLYHGEISARTDIYSLGLIILEITTREKNSSSTNQKHARKYIDRVREMSHYDLKIEF